MANFDSGVSRYIKGYCMVEVSFPVDNRGREDVSCNQCTYYIRSQRRCALNQEIVNYPDTHIGGYCPLTFEDEEEEE